MTLPKVHGSTFWTVIVVVVVLFLIYHFLIRKG
jgi:hypothetical protein